jgi:hypothetical protein
MMPKDRCDGADLNGCQPGQTLGTRFLCQNIPMQARTLDTFLKIRLLGREKPKTG